MKILSNLKPVSVLALSSALATQLALAGNPNPNVLPPNSKPYGKSYSEWSAAWWSWCYSLPVTGHPLFDTTGLNSDPLAGQSGPVVFLGGTFTYLTEDGNNRTIGQAVRHITLPPGKALFFPIANTEANNWPPPTGKEAQLRELAAWVTEHVANLTCTVDGRAVQGLSDGTSSIYRVQSPLFYYTLPAQDNLWQYWGYDFAGRNPAPGSIGDGVYLMLTPLPVGQHVIHFSGDIDIADWNSYFSLDITYYITITPR